MRFITGQGVFCFGIIAIGLILDRRTGGAGWEEQKQFGFALLW